MRLHHARYNDLVSWESEILGKGVLPVEGADAENCYIVDTATIGAGTKIYPGVIIVGEGYIGKNCVIGPYNRIENPRIGNGVKMKHHCGISHAIIDHLTNISEFVTVADFDGVEKTWTFIGQKCMIGVQARIMGGSRIDEECFVADGARVSGYLPPRTYFNSEKALKYPHLGAHHANCAWYLAGCYLHLKTPIPPGNRAEFLQIAQKKFGDQNSAEFRKWLTTPNLHMGGRMPARCIETIEKGETENDFKCLLEECGHGMQQDPKRPR